MIYEPFSYGLRGHFILLHLLLRSYSHEAFETFRDRIHISQNNFFEHVLIPDLVNRLIMQDQECTSEEADLIRMDSTAYGIEAYPVLDDDPIVNMLERDFRRKKRAMESAARGDRPLKKIKGQLCQYIVLCLTRLQ